MSRWTASLALLGTLVLAGAALITTATTTAVAATAYASAYTQDAAHAVYYKAAAGQSNHLAMTGNTTRFIIDDDVPIKPGAGCEYVNEADQTRVVCTLTIFGDFNPRTYVDLGDRKDDLVMRVGTESFVHAGPGDDTVIGTSADLIYGDEGSDTITGGYQRGGAGDDLLSAPTYIGGYGDAGNDTLVGSAGGNLLNGGPGNDTLLGRAGNDVMYGNSGNDVIYGGSGTDKLSGGPGKDEVHQ